MEESISVYVCNTRRESISLSSWFLKRERKREREREKEKAKPGNEK